MTRSFLKQYRSNLEEELRRQEFTQALENLRAAHPIFRKYPTIENLKNLAQAGNRNYSDKDEVMVILLKELKRSNAVYPLINVMFWNSLYRLYRQRRSRVIDHEELFGRIQWDFYHVVIRHDLERLPKKIDVNIFLNTKKKVIAWEKENIRQDEALRGLHDLSKVGLYPADLEESVVYPEEMEAYLLDMVYRKVINETQYDLLLDTRVYKRMNQKEWAQKKGISHTTVRTLKHRAEKVIRRFEEKRHALKSKPQL